MEPSIFIKGERVRYTIEYREYLEEHGKDVPEEGTVISQGNFGMTYILWDGKDIDQIETIPAKYIIKIEDEDTNTLAKPGSFEVFITMSKNKKTIFTGSIEDCTAFCEEKNYKTIIKNKEYTLDIRKSSVA